MPPVRRLAALTLAALAAAGCGRERLAVPDVERPVLTRATVPQAFPDEGVAFAAPGSWSVSRGDAPLLAQTSSGTATIAVWRYERTEPLPSGDRQLDAAQEALLGAVRQRDNTYREISTERIEVDGAPAIELVGEQRVAGRVRRVRSTHVYAHGAELVVDQSSEPSDFARLDAAIFRPLVRSLRVDPPR